MAQVARRGRPIRRMAQRLRNGDFDDLDSRASILLHTRLWKSGGIWGCTFQEANFFLSSSSIPCKTPHLEKTLSFFGEKNGASEPCTPQAAQTLNQSLMVDFGALSFS
jgi:hypothetical protein